MNSNDIQAFFDIWDVAAELYGKPQSVPAKKIAFKLLARFELADVEAALEAHMLDTEAGKWMPRPADIVQKIKGELPSPSEIVGLARAANTPLGCFALLVIGKWDLDNQDSYYLGQRGEEVRALLPEFVERARSGQYTNGEISLMKSKNINLGSELAPGLPGPSKTVAVTILETAKRIPAHVPHVESNPIDTKPAAAATLKLIHSEAAKRTDGQTEA